MKTIDCALAQDLMPLYTEGMLSPESREALEEHLAGCEACRRTADEMCHPLLEPQFQEEARLLRRLRRRRKALWAAVIVLAALPVVAVVLFFARDFGKVEKPPKTRGQTLLLSLLIGLIIGLYDGLVGPGTGTFLAIGFSLVDMLNRNERFSIQLSPLYLAIVPPMLPPW